VFEDIECERGGPYAGSETRGMFITHDPKNVVFILDFIIAGIALATIAIIWTSLKVEMQL